MNYGMEIAASGALAAFYRQQVLTNNLANINTVAFKPEAVGTMQRDPARIEDNLPYMPSSDLLEQLGAGVLNAPNRIVFTPGTLEQTGNALDVAIDGQGFMVVRDLQDGQSERIRLTRDGRLTLNSDSQLVQSSTGMPVLDASGRAITIDPNAPVDILEDGTVRQGEDIVGKIDLVDVPDRAHLKKVGAGLYAPNARQLEQMTPAEARLRQRHIEGSAVDPISVLIAMTGASRSAQGAISMIDSQDRLMEQAISVLGRVA